MTTSCNIEDEEVAGVKHFYFEFIDTIQSEQSTNMINDVSSIFPMSDYIMSEESAADGWPFYGNVERESKVLKTDMMPPHSNVNRLSPISELSNYNEGEHTMKVVYTLTSSSDTTMAISKESFEWGHEEWRKFSKKMTTEFNLTRLNHEDLVDKISKTLIRYTFK